MSPPQQPPISLNCPDLISPHFFSIFAFYIGLWSSRATLHLNPPSPAHVIRFPICANVCKRLSFWVERMARVIFSLASTVELQSLLCTKHYCVECGRKFASVGWYQWKKKQQKSSWYTVFMIKQQKKRGKLSGPKLNCAKELPKPLCALKDRRPLRGALICLVWVFLCS